MPISIPVGRRATSTWAGSGERGGGDSSKAYSYATALGKLGDELVQDTAIASSRRMRVTEAGKAAAKAGK